jgi:hypothetical protein
MDNYTILHLFVDVPGAVSSVGFGVGGGTGDETVGAVGIPVVLTVPAGYTNWPPSLWLKGEVDAASTAQYGVDYRMGGMMETRFANFTTVFTNHLILNVISNGALHSRTVVLNLVPLTSASHMGPMTTFTYAIIPPGADEDADGMPDWWEWRFDGSFTNLHPTADTDFDGTSNLAEFLADTDPADPGSTLAITGIRTLPAGVLIDWKGGSNAFQYLECRPGMVGTSELWKAIFTNVPITTLSPSHLHPDASGTSLFYRIRATR